jgi:hypothetical protein
MESLEDRRLLSAVTVLPAHANVAGKSIAQWSTSWWQWAASFTAPNDPISDTTGQYANLKQKGPVFFAAANATPSLNKSFDVPADKYVLIPLLVVELSQLELGFDQEPAQVKQTTSGFADLIDELHASIDGVSLPNLFAHRESSGQFSFTAAANNPVGIVPADPNTQLPAKSGAAFADGYWLMIAPFKGSHVFNFGGAISSFGFSIDATERIRGSEDTQSSQAGGASATSGTFARFSATSLSAASLLVTSGDVLP